MSTGAPRDIGIEGYEPGNGFQPTKLGISLRELLTLFAFNAICAVLRAYVGNKMFLALLGAVWGGAFLAVGTREILNPERREEGNSEKGARRVRIQGIIEVMIGTTIITLVIGSMLFLAEAW